MNCFNQHTAAELFRLGARRIVALGRAHHRRDARAVAAPWEGDGFDVLALRPPRRDDDRALRAVGGVRPRADDVPRSVRAEAPERRAHRSRRATAFPSPRIRPAATGSCTRGRSRAVGVPAAALARRASRTSTSCSTWPATRSRQVVVAAIAPRSSAGRRSAPGRERRACASRRRRVHARPLRSCGLAMTRARRDLVMRRAARRSARSGMHRSPRPTLDEARAMLRAALRLSRAFARGRSAPSPPCSPAATRSSCCPPAAASRSATRCRR